MVSGFVVLRSTAGTNVKIAGKCVFLLYPYYTSDIKKGLLRLFLDDENSFHLGITACARAHEFT